MLVSQPFIIPPNLPDNTMLPSTVRTFRFVVREASAITVQTISQTVQESNRKHTVDDNYDHT